MPDDLHNSAVAKTIAWLMKIRGISQADAAVHVNCAIKSPLLVTLPTLEELDAMPAGPDYDPEMICLT